MPVYEYRGLDAQGKNKKGLLESDGERSLKEALRKKGIFVTSVKASGKQKGAARGGGFFTRDVQIAALQRISVDELAMMTRQLATLLNAGVPMVDSLIALIEQVDNQKLKSILAEVKSDVNEGSTLAKALAKHKCFTKIYINMVRAGESSGALDVVLERLAEFSEGQASLKSKVLGAMLYPVVMAVVGVAMLTIVFTTVMPKITQIFQHSKVPLPFLTRMLLGVNGIFQDFWWLFLLLFVGLIVGFFKWKKTKSGQLKWDGFRLRVPIFGDIARMVAVARLTRTLSTLLSSGVALLASLEIVKNVVSNKVLEMTLEDVAVAVREGEDIATPMKRSGHFPPMVTHMIAIGEKTGELENMLGRVATNYESQVETKVGMLTSLLEPIMILVMGVTVGVIVFAILTPIIQMSQVVG